MKLKKVLQNHEERISSNEELLQFFKEEAVTRTEFRAGLAELKSDIFTKIDDFVGLYIKVDHEQVAMRLNLARHNRNFEKIEGELNLGLDY